VPDLVIGHINFINVIPVDVEMVNSDYRKKKVLGVPSVLNRALLDGSVDIGFFSSVFFLRNKKRLMLAGPFGIASRSKAMSVILGSRVKLEDYNAKCLYLYESPASETSVFLNRVVLREYFKLDFKLVRREEALAELLIGDEALLANYKKSFPFVYDIGEYWEKLTGFPAVFAVLATRPEIKSRKAAELEQYLADLDRVLDLFEKEPARFIEAARLKTKLPEAFLRSYFASLNYRLTEKELGSLNKIEEFLKNESAYEPEKNS